MHACESTRTPRRPAGERRAVPVERRWPRPVGLAGHQLTRLRQQRVLIVGTGSVGGRIALHLARLGIGAMKLCDPKTVKPESLLTHEVVPADVGRAKAGIVARRCRGVCPATRVAGFVGPVEALPFAEFAEADLVMMAPDRLEAELFVAQWAMHLGVPLIQAAVHGDTLTAQVRCFGHASAAGPCAGCFFGPREWAEVGQAVSYSCEGLRGSGAAAASPPAREALPEPFTASFSFLCGLAAALAVNQAVRLLLGLGAPVADTQLEFCGITNRIVISPLARSSACRLEHWQARRVAFEKPLAAHSLAALAEAALGQAASPQAVFALSGLRWVERGACRCPVPGRVERFLPAGRNMAGRCRVCGTPMRPLDFFSVAKVGVTGLGEALTVPVGKLGARRVRAVWVRDANTGAVIVPARHRSNHANKAIQPRPT